jgi:hypothetical protein
VRDCAEVEAQAVVEEAPLMLDLEAGIDDDFVLNAEAIDSSESSGDDDDMESEED